MSNIDRYNTIFGPMFHRSVDEVIGQSLRRYGQWAIDEIALFARLMTDAKGGDFIDLGANVGTHTIAMASLFPESMVYAFEANPSAFQLLSSNLTISGLPNVRLHGHLVGENSVMTRVASNEHNVPRNLGATSFHVLEQGSLEGQLILQVAVDDVYPKHQTVSIVKADLEGMEWEAMLGLQNTLTRCHPTIYIEYREIQRSGELLKRLKSFGYEIFWHVNFPFDSENYLGDQYNIFGDSVELASLCIHNDALTPALLSQLIRIEEPFGADTLDRCKAFNYSLRTDLKKVIAQQLARTSAVRAFCANLVTEYQSGVRPEMDTGVRDLPSFSAVRQATLLEIPGQDLRDILKQYISTAIFNEQNYLDRNPDVAGAVNAGLLPSAKQHYTTTGYFEGRTDSD